MAEGGFPVSWRQLDPCTVPTYWFIWILNLPTFWNLRHLFLPEGTGLGLRGRVAFRDKKS